MVHVQTSRTEILSNYWLLGAFGHALNWHCQLLELSKLAVPCTDLFLRSKLATVATKFIVKLAAAIVTATTRRSVATLAYLADALDRRANWVATLSEPALAVLVNALHRRYARKKRCPTRDARLNIRTRWHAAR